MSLTLSRHLLMEDTGISALRPGGPAPELEVRVIRMWKPAFRDNETCYVFVDKEVVAKGADQRAIASKHQLQCCYRINGYACTEPDKYTSTLGHPVHMRIGTATSFTPTDDTTEFPKAYFEFASRERVEYIHEKIKKLPKSENRFLVDYIGIIQDMKDNHTRAGNPFVTIKLKDIRNKEIEIALWEEIATCSNRFPRVAIEASVYPVILAFTASRVADFNGKMQLQSTSATHVYLSPATVEGRMLLDLGCKKKALKKIIQVSVRIYRVKILEDYRPILPYLKFWPKIMMKSWVKPSP